ncbi:MAG: peptide chain release factor N(5)-glutamine methyltransferase [Alistipes sp.]|nr:peptide chain release factor N(5)-glutamine methyltransferase [Alistipes sp.]
MATRRELYLRVAESITELYGDIEARQIAEMIVTECGAITRSQLLVEPNKELEIKDIDRIIEELRSWRPVQYVIGRAEFDDMSLEVREGVLIPRPETEELVEWVASEAGHDARILDVGTGSGCIALALSRRLKNSSVWALDISPEALDIARRNGAKYAPSVQFVEGDALADFSSAISERLDVLVSNPPYIPRSDESYMRRNVTYYEPSSALFVEDSDPLIFYRSIARTARKMLKPRGKLFYEIYEHYAADMVAMLEVEGYQDIVVREDFRGKQRMVCATMSL